MNKKDIFHTTLVLFSLCSILFVIPILQNNEDWLLRFKLLLNTDKNLTKHYFLKIQLPIIILWVTYFITTRGVSLSKNRKSLIIMGIGTFIWVSIISVLIYYQLNEQSINSFMKSEKYGLNLNSWGDFFAGFVAPLALGWLAYSIYYQKEEFENVRGAFVKQQKILEDQLTELHIEKLHTWFDRNTKILNSLLAKLNESKDKEKDTPLKINKAMDIETNDTFFNIYDKIQSIVNLDKYMNYYISQELKNNKDNNEKLSTLEELKKEYNILYEKDILQCKYILIKVYLLISKCEESNFKKYRIYETWLEREDENLKQSLIEYINKQNSTFSDDLNEKLGNAFKNIVNSKLMEKL